MGTDFQRTILWVFFGLSLFLLWDRWLVYNGRPSMFGTAPAPTAPAPSAAPPSATKPDTALTVSSTAPAPGAVPATPAPESPAAAAKVPPIVIDTDVMHVTIDPEGAVLSRVALVRERVAPDWTKSGLLGLVTGKSQDGDQPVVLLDVSPHRVYVA